MAVYQGYKKPATAQDWQTSSREPVGLAPDPATTSEAVLQVYGARAFGWRGNFGVHTWIAAKPTGAKFYTVYEVIGWRLRWSNSPVAIHQREPDARWFGNAPDLLTDLRGPGVDNIIRNVDKAARDYPYHDRYTVWPGPNSNTFTAFIARQVPEMSLDLPPTAIGKDYLGSRLFAKAPSGSGFQFSLFGVLGVMVALEEGLELNILGLAFGIDPKDPAVKLPLAGQIGFPRRPRQTAAVESAAVPEMTGGKAD
ncbi:MAG: DUF3750 domain-containing protein [Pseudomonadota bacterium]|nr:DUF3750 domain-containing protein [Pseudomonadota bacterium]